MKMDRVEVLQIITRELSAIEPQLINLSNLAVNGGEIKKPGEGMVSAAAYAGIQATISALRTTVATMVAK